MRFEGMGLQPSARTRFDIAVSNPQFEIDCRFEFMGFSPYDFYSLR
jgi:hypothetical protein